MWFWWAVLGIKLNLESGHICQRVTWMWTLPLNRPGTQDEYKWERELSTSMYMCLLPDCTDCTDRPLILCCYYDIAMIQWTMWVKINTSWLRLPLASYVVIATGEVAEAVTEGFLLAFTVSLRSTKVSPHVWSQHPWDPPKSVNVCGHSTIEIHQSQSTHRCVTSILICKYTCCILW